MMASSHGRVLIYGGSGALGSACVQLFRSKNWWVSSVDLNSNSDANVNVLINENCLDSWTAQESEVVNGVDKALEGGKLDAVVCVAGGWAGGNALSDDLVKNADLMVKQSVWSSVIAAKLAAKFLKEGGVLALTGAKAALEGTPGMIGYGLAKAAVHQLVQSLNADKSGLPLKSSVLAILPITLDTPMNRKFMPKADFSSWTSLEFVSELMHKWATDQENRPKSGSLVQLVTSKGQTELVITGN